MVAIFRQRSGEEISRGAHTSTESTRPIRAEISPENPPTRRRRPATSDGGEESEVCGETSTDLSREEGSSIFANFEFVCGGWRERYPPWTNCVTKVLKQLVTCGSVTVRDCESVKSNLDGGLSMGGARRDGAA
ncbi:hypothetical protein Acr_02g0004330 [Actinidia rufa]|uniref:Uncharacterized protein n=1 Tax=Actinidia rufa TaxID=165716 RepID=A0A7J0E6S0_9ERIC|nr:hypothetical protein Acr_02g0004330 [Actinidia rufa]